VRGTPLVMWPGKAARQSRSLRTCRPLHLRPWTALAANVHLLYAPRRRSVWSVGNANRAPGGPAGRQPADDLSRVLTHRPSSSPLGAIGDEKNTEAVVEILASAVSPRKG
jgi:hypothetical protein